MVSLRYCMRGFFKCIFMRFWARLAFSVMMPVIFKKCVRKGVFRLVFFYCFYDLLDVVWFSGFCHCRVYDIRPMIGFS